MGGSTTISSESPRIGALRYQQSSYGTVVPIVYGRTRVSGNLIWYGDFVAIATTTTTESGGKGGGGVKQTNTTYTYEAAVAMAVCEGAVSSIPSIWKGKERHTDISELGLTLATGAEAQGVWGHLTTNHPSEAIGYSGTAYLYSPNYSLSDNAEVENHTFEVSTTWEFSSGGGIYDANPASFSPDLLTNVRYGAMFPSSKIGSLTRWSDYIRAFGLFISPALTEAKECREWLNTWATITNSAFYWSEGTLKVEPYGDESATANGATFTPNTTAIYDLTDDDFLKQDDEDPVTIERRTSADAFNQIQVEFINRDNQYNVEVVTATDQRNVDEFGLRPAPVAKYHDITTQATARTVAQLLLQRSLYVRNTYEFRLGWKYALLEPMDLVTITDAGLGLDRTPVRIISTEENEWGDITVRAEDFTAGIASTPLYATQPATGFSHQYNASPGGVVAPTFIEPPVTMSTTGLEVWAAVTGNSPLWGGCRVWVSLDGDSYKAVGVVNGGSRYGTLTASLASGSGGTAAVQLVGNGGKMLSGSAADAASLATLCWVGDPSTGNGEYFAHASATLTGANAYSLTGLVRGAYGTTAAARSSGAKFVRVDPPQLAKSDALDLSMIGKVIYFKFTSFNIYGGGEQSVAEVPAYNYTISGYMAKLPPSNVASMSYALEGFGVRLSWPELPEGDLDGYEIRFGSTTWESATFLATVKGSSYLWAVQAAGTQKVWIKAKDKLGNYSATATSTDVSIAAPSSTTPSVAIIGPDIVLTWSATTGAFAIDRYEIRYGSTWAGGTLVAAPLSTNYREKITYGGSRRYWVAAIDVAGNYSTPVSVDVSVASPGVVQTTRSEVVDNNALLYWAAPATGSLPVDRYEVRKGASWATGTVVGSNGNSTFTTIFEQSAGTYTYWVAAVDTAGNVGTAVGIVATIQQPPDYVLRTNINSTFGGTLTNMYLDSGKLYGPVDTSQTWATHFTANGWTTPQNQMDAGYPIYINPSVTSGSYQEDFDYGTALPATIVTATLGSAVLSGSVAVSCQIQYKLNSGDAWTSAAAGQTQVLLPSFRYVRITWTFTCTAGANLIEVSSFNLKLAMKLKTDSGTGYANAGDAGGTTVNFNVAFVDADTPIIQPGGATPYTPVVDFTDTPNPTSFKVLLYDRNGTRVSGPFSWTARGA